MSDTNQRRDSAVTPEEYESVGVAAADSARFRLEILAIFMGGYIPTLALVAWVYFSYQSAHPPKVNVFVLSAALVVCALAGLKVFFKLAAWRLRKSIARELRRRGLPDLHYLDP